MSLNSPKSSQNSNSNNNSNNSLNTSVLSSVSSHSASVSPKSFMTSSSSTSPTEEKLKPKPASNTSSFRIDDILEKNPVNTKKPSDESKEEDSETVNNKNTFSLLKSYKRKIKEEIVDDNKSRSEELVFYKPSNSLMNSNQQLEQMKNIPRDRDPCLSASNNSSSLHSTNPSLLYDFAHYFPSMNMLNSGSKPSTPGSSLLTSHHNNLNNIHSSHHQHKPDLMPFIYNSKKFSVFLTC